MKTQTELYDLVTTRIVDLLEKCGDWECPFRQLGNSIRPTRANGEPYKGINSLLLGFVTLERGYKSSYWMTFKQALELGGCVRKGEKGTTACLYNVVEKEKENEQGEIEKDFIPFLKHYTVFNADQIDGLPADYYGTTAPISERTMPEIAERLIQRSEMIYKIADSAYYHRGEDSVNMPPVGAFATDTAYVATLFHEAAHWTGAPHRLDRTKGKRFGDADYAFEELVAELTAAFCCQMQGVLDTRTESQSAAYIKSWLKILKSDRKAIFTAASKAQAAADYISTIID